MPPRDGATSSARRPQVSEVAVEIGAAAGGSWLQAHTSSCALRRGRVSRPRRRSLCRRARPRISIRLFKGRGSGLWRNLPSGRRNAPSLSLRQGLTVDLGTCLEGGPGGSERSWSTAWLLSLRDPTRSDDLSGPDRPWPHFERLPREAPDGRERLRLAGGLPSAGDPARIPRPGSAENSPVGEARAQHDGQDLFA